jgi:lipoprotein signal peptidase
MISFLRNHAMISTSVEWQHFVDFHIASTLGVAFGEMTGYPWLPHSPSQKLYWPL